MWCVWCVCECGLTWKIPNATPTPTITPRFSSISSVALALHPCTNICTYGRMFICCIHSHTEQDRALCVLERALPTELLLAGPNHSHTEQDRALCVLERALPTIDCTRKWIGNAVQNFSCLSLRCYHFLLKFMHFLIEKSAN